MVDTCNNRFQRAKRSASSVKSVLLMKAVCYFRDVWQDFNPLTRSWRRPLSYRNQSIDLLCKEQQELHNDQQNGQALSNNSFEFVWPFCEVGA